jgi:hypothetical protein
MGGSGRGTGGPTAAAAAEEWPAALSSSSSPPATLAVIAVLAAPQPPPPPPSAPSALSALQSVPAAASASLPSSDLGPPPPPPPPLGASRPSTSASVERPSPLTISLRAAGSGVAPALSPEPPGARLRPQRQQRRAIARVRRSAAGRALKYATSRKARE